MKYEQFLVRKFMREVKHLTPPSIPQLSTLGVRALCINLILEESLETTKALAVGNDLVDIADGLADTAYVVLYTANALGIELEPIFYEVQRSNMTKLGGTKRADGKQLKPDTYEPPDISPILKTQSPIEDIHSEQRVLTPIAYDEYKQPLAYIDQQGRIYQRHA